MTSVSWNKQAGAVVVRQFGDDGATEDYLPPRLLRQQCVSWGGGEACAVCSIAPHCARRHIHTHTHTSRRHARRHAACSQRLIVVAQRCGAVGGRPRCQCAACVDEYTGRPLLDPSTVAEDVEPVSIETKGNYAVGVTWSDGHTSSIYKYDTLHAIVAGTKAAEDQVN